MSIGLRTDAEPAEHVLECAAEPLAAMARLAGSGLFGDYVVYERPGSWTFAGGVLGEVVLEAGTVHARWHGLPPSARPWSGRPADALRDAFAEAPPGWNAYGWIAFEFAAPHPAGRLAHLIVPRTEVRVSGGRAHVTGPGAERVADLLAEAGPVAGAPSPVDVRVGGDAYRAKVAEAVAEIHAGRYQKVIVSRRLDVPHPVDVIATYVRGREANTPARSFLLDLGGLQAAGYSPEVLATVDAGGRVMTQPLAGTRAFGAGADADARTRRELENDPKEIFEHAVSVRTSLEELRRVCDPATVQVTDFMTVKERGSVQHLGSRAVGTLAPGRSPWDALFPGVTASGIPKPAAIEAITRLEDRRGMYSGAVVAVSHDGALDSALVLRALYSENGRAWLRAGAGIVGASTPGREYEETCEKLSSIAPHVVPLA
ncbi:salicylate synthase [Actinomadura monticuli]|uniref:Salicylate synthase n=1 Tax=Actinomadura monticuli TaxID=3097367 RepID=A0ABV4QJB0_9ACTN